MNLKHTLIAGLMLSTLAAPLWAAEKGKSGKAGQQATTSNAQRIEQVSAQAVQAYQANDFAQAATHFKTVVKLDPNNEKAWLFLGKCLAKSNDEAGARSAFSKVLSLQPTGAAADMAREQLATLELAKFMPVMVSIPNTNYEIGKYEVTQGQWKAVMGSNPSQFVDCGDTCPVEKVSWNDIQEFIQKLNTKTGKSYRLPSESEWQTACLAGSQTEYCGGNDLNAVAWYGDNSGSKTHPVGQKQANAYGLYDMSGNVWEWMQDCWDSSCSAHVLRGGSWNNLISQNLRAANRLNLDPSIRFNGFGFRLARTLP